jgi:hypothetical protein
MAVITPRNGATLALVVQTALNVAGRDGVSIETGGTGNGVRVPDTHLARIEAELGWTAVERADNPVSSPTHPATQEPTQVPVTGETTPAPPAPTEPEAKAAAPKKTTTSSRRARRGKEG